MKIRHASIKDLPQLTEILNQAIAWGKATAFTKKLRPEQRIAWFQRHTDSPYAIYLAEENDRVAGYISIGSYREGREAFRHVAEVSYFVDFDFHKRGIGTLLMEKALEHCRSKEIDTLLAFLYANNHPSIIFLEKFGFRRWGLFPALIRREHETIDHAIYGLKIDHNTK
jgi:phosphinothricin acetyltransferase